MVVLTWGELKRQAEAAGVKDSTEVKLIVDSIRAPANPEIAYYEEENVLEIWDE